MTAPHAQNGNRFVDTTSQELIVGQHEGFRVNDGHASPRVLVIDDDVTFLNTATNALLSDGFDVVSAQTGGDAIHHVSCGFVPAVVIMGTTPDIALVESVDTITHLSPATRVIFLANSLASATVLGRRGRCAVLIKPFELIDLVRAVHVMAHTPTNPPTSEASAGHGDADTSILTIGFIQLVWPWIAALILVAVAWFLTGYLSRSVSR